MQQIELKANIRETKGKGPARALRREGFIPAILYGPDADPVMLSISKKDLDNVLKKGSTGQMLVNISIENKKKPRTAMFKELQVHPVSQNFIHADFYEVSMDRKIKVKVPVSAVGKSMGVDRGGILQVIRRDLEIMCLPLEIPESIEIDTTDLDIGDSIHVEEIPLTGDIEIVHDVNFTVITVVAPKIEEVKEEEVEAEEEVEGEKAEEAEAEAKEPSEEKKAEGDER